MNKSFYALGRLKNGELNKTELEYQSYLEEQKQLGNVLWYKFEGIKLRLADNMFYNPDFSVMNKDHEMEIHEVKGFWQDDAKAKIKMASELYPFKFIAVYKKPKKDGGGWKFEDF